MNEVDDSILEFMEQLTVNDGTRVALNPTAIWVNLVKRLEILDRSPSTIGRRMGRLEEMGLLESVDDKRTYYVITDRGESYLAGEISRDEIPEPE